MTKFNPPYFMDICKQLIGNKSDNASMRTVIGRSYYTALLYCREYLETKRGYSFSSNVKHGDIWNQINPQLGKGSNSFLATDKNGRVYGNYLYHTYLVALGEVLKDLFELQEKHIKSLEKIGKIEKYLKYAIPELENLIECPYCNEYNPPDKKYCIYCQKEIIKEDLNEREKR